MKGRFPNYRGHVAVFLFPYAQAENGQRHLLTARTMAKLYGIPMVKGEGIPDG